MNPILQLGVGSIGLLLSVFAFVTLTGKTYYKALAVILAVACASDIFSGFIGLGAPVGVAIILTIASCAVLVSVLFWARKQLPEWLR